MRHITGTVNKVHTKQNGNIDSVQLESGEILSSDFFIDSTGFASILIQKTLKVPFVNYSDHLLNDSAVAIPTPMSNNNKIKPQTTSRALSCGWAWTIPLSNRNGNGYVYSSKYISSEDAEQELRAYLGIQDNPETPARHIKMRLGRVEQHWHKNVLAVGLSQGFIEPLEATALACIQYTVEHFIDCIDNARPESSFNYQINNVYDAIKDYISAHYQLNTRTDSQYWLDNRNSSATAKFAKIQAAWDDPKSDFERSLKQLNAEVMYFSPSWYALFAGKGRFVLANKKVGENIKHANVKDIDNYCEKNALHFKSHLSALPYQINTAKVE